MRDRHDVVHSRYGILYDIVRNRHDIVYDRLDIAHDIVP